MRDDHRRASLLERQVREASAEAEAAQAEARRLVEHLDHLGDQAGAVM